MYFAFCRIWPVVAARLPDPGHLTNQFLESMLPRGVTESEQFGGSPFSSRQIVNEAVNEIHLG